MIYSESKANRKKMLFYDTVRQEADRAGAGCCNAFEHGRLPRPELGVQDYAFFDTPGFEADAAEVNNGDGVIDAARPLLWA